MTDFTKKSYYFNLVGKRVWSFRVDCYEYLGWEPMVQLTLLNRRLSGEPTTKVQLEADINTLMTKYSLKYVEVNDEEEIARLKLFYEA